MVGRVTPNSAAICSMVWTRRPSGPVSSYICWAMRPDVGRVGFLVAGAAAAAGGGEAVEGALPHQCGFELGDGAEDLEEHPADRGGGLDALVEHDQVDAALLQLGGQVDEVFEGVAEPVELGDYEWSPRRCVTSSALSSSDRASEFGDSDEFRDRP